MRTSGLALVLAMGWACGGNTAHKHALTSGAAPPTSVMAMEADPGFNTEAYDHIAENDFIQVADRPLSTFSIDVDTASYSNVRRFLHQGQMPPAGAVRVEELINYFNYDYPDPAADQPFSVTTEVSQSPWSDNVLVHIGLQGKRMTERDLPARNLVFLLDVSGSMSAANKLPLLQSALKLLVENLDERDRVAMVVYAGAAGQVLAPTAGDRRTEILAAIDRLQAGGSTNGGQGIELAYRLAEANFDQKAINRVILATDGDFNVGTTDQSSLVELIEAKRKTGVFLTVLGFGMGNLKDSTMEKLADHGNGNYAYIDSLAEARKVLVNEAGSTLVTIAKDVKIQVEMNPALVHSYRLIGYENRLLADRDFNDDEKDAGDIGAGHSVTALYEVVLAQNPQADEAAAVDPLVYQSERTTTRAADSNQLLNIKLRYKQPDADDSQLITLAVDGTPSNLTDASDDFRFAAAVAGFGMLLRSSPHAQALTWQRVTELASGARGRDRHGYRAEFLELIERAQALSPGPAAQVAR